MPTQDSRHTFFSLLRAALNSEEFRARLALLLDGDPYFVPAYLEHIWLSEMRGDLVMCRNLEDRLHHVIQQILFNKAIRMYVNETWSAFELESMKDAFCLLKKRHNTIFKMLLMIEESLARIILKPKTRIQATDTYLKLIRRINVAPLVREIQNIAPYWWNVSTERSEKIHYHKHAYSIMLRWIPTKHLTYEPLDGEHESEPTFFADRFPVIHSTILSIAKELRLGLGRVAIVRLPPYTQSYRHYDAEAHYAGRNRYHLVVSAGQDNILSSGDETAHVRVGELWFFANKVMHRAHNKSSVSRIHIIFDAYPLGKDS